MRERHVSLTDAAGRLGISYGRALRLVLIGELSGFKFDGHWLVSFADLERAALAAEKARIIDLPLAVNAHDGDTER
jgi:hypothetical protein